MSGKHTFNYEPDTVLNPYDVISVKVETQTVQLEKIISAMEAYLLACGYVFPDNCHLGWEEDEGIRLDEADISTHPDNGS